MDLLNIDTTDFKEILFDMSPLRKAFYNKDSSFKTDLGVEKTRLGTYHLKTQKMGHVYFTKTETYFTENILAKTSKSINNISIYFIGQGNGMYDYDFHTHTYKKCISRTINVLMMHEDYQGKGIYSKHELQKSKSIHLSISYFETLTMLYPDIFETALLRYQKGETFYIADEYMPITPQMYQILSQLENSRMMGNCSTVYSDAKVLELLSTLLIPQATYQKFSEPSIVNQKDKEKINEAAFVLLTDMHQPPSIRNLSLKVGINEKKLKNGFKELFGTTVYGYLFKHKMTLAKQLLIDSNKAITEIAMDCGYEYASHFSTAFKRYYGISPKDMRKTQPFKPNYNRFN